MSNNLKRHKLLKILAEKYIKGSQGKEPALGVSWEELTSKMNLTMDELLNISSTLYSEEEVAKHDAHGIKGMYAKMKGVSAYSSKKYKREHERIVFERVKNWIQTIVPVLSLAITLVVVILSEFRTQKNKTEIDTLTRRLNSLETEIAKDRSKENSADTVKVSPLR